MYNKKIYWDWIKKNHYLWWNAINVYGFNLKRSFVFFTEDEESQKEYLEFSKTYVNGGG